MNHAFFPTEIIFSATDACNLHCPHCFVSRSPNKLEIQTAQNFLKNCVQSVEKNPELPRIEKIGFSGGEPFLYLDFICELTKTAVNLDFLFDQIMTNGDWWQDEADLNEKLTQLYNAGYDGKIGVSYDNFHAQKPERMTIFISTVQKIFGEDSVNIQTVGESLPLAPAAAVSQSATTAASATPSAGSNATRNARLNLSSIKQYFLPQSFPSNDERAWKSKHWFKDDYCQGPGNILYIHPDGNIAPCCGFANENPALFIGKITDSYETIIKNAEKNQLVKICFETGLGKYRKQLKKQLRKQGKNFPGKCGDICSFCDYVVKIE